MRHIHKPIAITLFFVLAVAVAGAEDAKPFGIIFNTGSLLLEIESYQAGIGIKVPGDKFAMRYHGDVFAANNFSTISLGAGAALEKHLGPGKASPYIGGFGSFSFTSQRTETDEENWVQNMSIPISAGGILGVEYFLLDNVSIFGEYALALDFGFTVNRTSTAGIVESTTDFTIAVDSRIGNGSKIGIVIYVK